MDVVAEAPPSNAFVRACAVEARRKEELDQKISESQASFQKYVQTAGDEDPYEGLSPEEINALQAGK